MLNGENTQYKEKARSKIDSGMTQMFESLDREFKITMITMVKNSNEKSRQHARTDG